MERWVKRTIELGAGLVFTGKNNPSVVPYYPQKTDICGEEEQYFGCVEADLDVDQFHFETAFKNLFLAKIEGNLLFFAVFTHFFQIILIGGANHLFKLTDDLTVGHVVVLTCDLAALGTSGCGNDDV